MIRNLILIGLFVLPLFVIHGYDFRFPREILALGLALAVTMYGLLNKSLYCDLSSKGILLFIGWAFISTLFIPHIQGLNIAGGDSVDGLWNQKALFTLVSFSLCFFVISNSSFSDEDLNKMFYAVMIPALITACIMIGQYFGIENFFKNPVATNEVNQKLTAVTQYKIGGLMGHPTISSAYLAICLPITLYLRRYFFAVVMLVALLMADSDVAKGAIFLSVLFFTCYGSIKKCFFGISFLVTLFLFLASLHYQIHESGRFMVWSQIWHDVTTPFMTPNGITYFFTGFGLGSFAYLFPGIHSNTWLQAHNEYLQVLFGVGAVGFGIMVYYIFKLFKENFFNWFFSESKLGLTLMTTLFAICVCAGGTFVWQLGVFQFYTVVILGIIYQKRKIS